VTIPIAGYAESRRPLGWILRRVTEGGQEMPVHAIVAAKFYDFERRAMTLQTDATVPQFAVFAGR
jgi:hypothetical protein